MVSVMWAPGRFRAARLRGSLTAVREGGACSRPELPPTHNRHELYCMFFKKKILTSFSSSFKLTILIMGEPNSELIFPEYPQTFNNPTLPHLN